MRVAVHTERVSKSEGNQKCEGLCMNVCAPQCMRGNINDMLKVSTVCTRTRSNVNLAGLEPCERVHVRTGVEYM